MGYTACKVNTTAKLAGIRDARDMSHDNETDLLLADDAAIVAHSSDDIQLPTRSSSDAKW